MKHSIRDIVKESSRSDRSKRFAFDLQRGKDVKEKIEKAINVVELEREIDGNQRKQLAGLIKSQGLKISKEATRLNELDANLCDLERMVGVQFEKLRIQNAIEDEIINILDVLENCDRHKLPTMLSDVQLLNLCNLYSSKENCRKIKQHYKRLGNCQVSEKYLLNDRVSLDLKIQLPLISELSVAALSTIPIFHDEN